MLSQSKKNIIGISLVGVAQAMSGGFVGLYIGMFYTDVLGLSAAAMGLLVLLARIWDASTDPIAGVIIDNSKTTKIGKYKPYLIVSNVLLTLLTILMFTAPQWGLSGKLAYAYVIYFTWSVVFTFMPIVPLMSNVVTEPKDRDLTASIQRITILLFGFTASAFVPLAEKLGGGGNGYSLAISIFMIPLMIISLIGVLLVKETKEPQATKEKVVYKDMIRLFKDNKPMRIFAVYIFISGMIKPFMNAALVYYVKYHFGISKMVYIFPLAMGGFIIGVSFSAILLRFMGRNKLLVISYSLQAVVFFGLYLFGASSFIVAMVLIAAIDITMGLVVTAETTMSIEIMDYNLHTKGNKMSGLISCLNIFLNKLQPAIAGAIVGFALSLIGFVANAPITPEVSKALLVIGFLIPAIFALFTVVVVFFYPINREKAEFLAAEAQSRKG